MVLVPVPKHHMRCQEIAIGVTAVTSEEVRGSSEVRASHRVEITCDNFGYILLDLHMGCSGVCMTTADKLASASTSHKVRSLTVCC